jgi:hypothetical protein
MKRVLIILAFVGFALAAPCIAWTDDPTGTDSLVGEWKNGLDKPSTLKIKSIDSTTGMLTGTYYEGSTGAEEPVIGYVNSAVPDKGDNVRVLSFTVRWSKFGSITSWAGYLRIDPNSKAPTLYMQWNLTRANSNFDWDHIISNQDRFTKSASAKK